MAVQERSGAPAGPLRISAPTDLSTAHLGPLLGQFVIDHPQVDVTLETSNTFVDLIAEGFDVALRVHAAPLPSVTSMRARRLATLDRGLYASPGYLGQHGRPRRPDELNRHACLTMAT